VGRAFTHGTIGSGRAEGLNGWANVDSDDATSVTRDQLLRHAADATAIVDQYRACVISIVFAARSAT
jgi:hypothetical protein